MTCGRVGSGLVPELRGKPLWGKRLAFSGRVRQCAFAHSFHAVKHLREYGPHGELLFFLIQKKRAFVPDSEAFNSFIGHGFRIPELRGGSEASDDDQADNLSFEALYVIGLHGSDDKTSLCLEMAKVALSCHVALEMLCQEMHELERTL